MDLPLPTLPRQEALLLAAVLYLLGLAATASRLLRARQHGVSIRMQVFLSLIAATSVLAFFFSVVVVDRLHARAAWFAHEAAADEARLVADLALGSMETARMDLDRAAAVLRASRLLTRLAGGPEGERVQVLDRRGEVLADSHPRTGDPPHLRDRPEVAAALSGRPETRARQLDPSRVVAAAPIQVRGGVVGAVRVEKPTQGMTQLMADFGPKVALLALLLALAAAGAAIAIGRAVGAPLERLTEAAERIAAGHRLARLPTPRGREARALTRAFEHMRTELEQRNLMERMAQDLSHELKNPIAAIRAAAEVLEEGSPDGESTRRFARRIDEAARRMQQLVADLLALARLEAHGLSGGRQPLDLRGVVQDAVEAARTPEDSRAGPWDVRLPESAPVVGDPRWLRRAVDNLLSNALSYAPPGTPVGVYLSRTPDGWSVCVTDQGPGVDPRIRERLFQRFVTSRPDRGGSGLGLAIVQAVAEAHGGRARLVSTGDHGACFEMAVRET